MKPLFRTTRLAGAVSLIALLGCGPDHDPAGPEMEAAAGAKGSGITVSSADPGYGHQGDVQKQVRIRGSGFEPGDQASWQRGGTTDPKIQVVTTTYVSSNELVATINIDATAALTFYDIAIIRPGRKGGIGTMLFEVTTIQLLPEFAGQDGQAMDINDGGEIVGYTNLTAVRWDPVGNIEDLGPGSANAIDAATTRIVGTTSLDLGASQASLWSGSPGSWVRTTLASTCVGVTVPTSMGSAVSSNGTFAGGWLRVLTGSGRKATTVLRAVRWNLVSGTCTLLVDPPGGFAPTVKGINDLGMATGHGVFWDESGNGENLPPWPGESAAYSYTLNEAGTIVAGRAGSRAVYWRRMGGVWSQPIELPSGSPCQSGNQGQANDISDSDLIVGVGCDGGAWYWQLNNGVLVSSTRLPGLGPQGDGVAQAVRSGATAGAAWIVGGAKGQPVFWPQ